MAADFDVKLRFLFKQLAWTVVMFLILPISLWGMFLGWEYRNDECVSSNWYYQKLDWWLMGISFFNLMFSFIVELLLCCHAPSKLRKVVILPLHVVNLATNGVGIWLIYGAENVSGCNHNELWIFSIVVCSLTLGTAIFLIIVYAFYRCGLCVRLGRLLSIEDNSYAFHIIQDDMTNETTDLMDDVDSELLKDVLI
jgi:hypothetical protein